MSRGKFFRKVLSGTRETTQIQTNIEQAVAGAIRSPLLDGRLVEDVSLTATATRLEHKLGRKPLGYLVIKQSAAANVFDGLSSEASPELFLPLTSSVAVTVSLWIF